MLLRYLIIFCLLSSASNALELSGVFKQGGFIIGQTSPGTDIFYNEDKIPVGANGTFVIGLHRNHPAEARIKASTSEHQTIIIEPRDYKTQAITGIPKRKVDPLPEDLKHIKQDKKKILAARAHFSDLTYMETPFSQPVSATISGVYGSKRTFNGKERSWHKGVDFAAPTGTPITAPAQGIVRLALKDSFFNGNLVILDHGHQLMTVYAHLNEITVKEGQNITQGQQIGTVGMTGRATGPHLHMGLYWRNIALDPMFLLQKVTP